MKKSILIKKNKFGSNHTFKQTIENLVNNYTISYFKKTKQIQIKLQLVLGPLVGGDLGRDHEQWLCGHAGGHPVAVVNWPRDIKPFYMR